MRTYLQNANHIALYLLIGVCATTISCSSTAPAQDGERAKLLAARRQIDAYKTALGVFELDNGFFPSTDQGLEALVEPSSASVFPNSKGPYLDPPEIRKDPWGNDYIYKRPATHNPNSYDLMSMGPDGRAGSGDDIGNW